MEIYCHPVANGTYYFSGACSSTGRCHSVPCSLDSRLLAWPGRSLPSLSIVDAHSLGCDSTSTLQYARCLALPLPHITFILFCVRTRLTPSCAPSPLHAIACVLCMFSQRWSLKACNVPLPHSTAFFFNTSIYSSFGQLPQKKKKKRKKNCREMCVKKCPFTAPQRNCSPQLASEIRANTRYQYLCNFLWLRLLKLPSLLICFCGCQRQLLFGPESRVLCAKVPCILARN